MGGGGTKTTTFTPWGNAEFGNLLGNANQQYSTISSAFPDLFNEARSTYQAIDPERSIAAQKRSGLQTIQESFAPQYRQAIQGNVARFGGINNSVGRDLQAEIGKSQARAGANLANQLEGNLYNMQQQQYQNAMQALGLPISYGNFLQGVAMNAPRMASVNQTTTEPIWTDWIAPALQAGSTAAMILSDKRAKKDIKKIGEVKGVNIYEFKYKPEFNKGDETTVGVIAQEIENLIPNSVKELDGLKHVNYNKVFEYLGA
jgi:hypothetical protein